MTANGTLYKHRIFCLHGSTGQIASDVNASDATIPVEAAVIQDMTIAVGKEIQLTDGTNTSPFLTILAIDSESPSITVNVPVGHAFLAATPTIVNRAPHWAYKWTETTDDLTVCPDDSTHPTQPGSAGIVGTREPDTVHIVQSVSMLSRPAAEGKRLEVPAGQTASIDFSWPYVVNIQSMAGYFESSNPEDRYDVLSGPNTPVGTLTASVAAGETVIPVSSTVVENVRPSLLCTLSEGLGSTVNSLGRILAVSVEQGTITVESATTDAFATSAVVLVTSVHTLEMPIPQSTQPITVGGDVIEGRDAPPGTIVRIVYHNRGASPAAAVVIIKLLT